MIDDDIAHVAKRMRERDRREIVPLMFSEDQVVTTATVSPIKHVMYHDGDPVAALGAFEQSPCWWSVWMFATGYWPRVALSASRCVKRDIIPTLVERGANRADCWSLDEHTTAHRWLERLGARREATISDCGPFRSTYHCYAWTRSEFEKGSF